MAPKAAQRIKIVKPHTYLWQGYNTRGDINRGEIETANLNLAKLELRRQGIRIKAIRKKAKPVFGVSNKKIVTADIAFFSRQLATMLRSGIPIVSALDIIARGHPKTMMKDLINSIKKDIESGTTLADTLKKHPCYFDNLYCHLIAAGEQSGTLDEMLGQIAVYKEKIESLKKKIKKALFYPATVLTVAFFVTAILLLFVVPQFEMMFADMGATLPAFTRFVLGIARGFQHFWWLIGVIIAGASYWLVHAKRHSPAFRQRLENISFKIPIIRSILKNASVARFTRTLAITFAAGMALTESLSCVAEVVGNTRYKEAALQVREDVTQGQTLQYAIERTQQFSDMVVQMVELGEEAGTLEEMLTKIATFYEEEVDNAVDALSSLLEPTIMLVLGVVIGGLIAAMYLPIFRMGSIM